MKTFEQVLDYAARHGGVNLLFEHGMYSLMDDAQRIVAVLREAQVPFEIVGGLAVNAHVYAVDRSRTAVTREVDLLVRRQDLERIVDAGTASGYTGRKMMGGLMLIRPNQTPKEAVHLLFAGEKPRSTYPLTNPAIQPEEKVVDEFGISIPVAPLRDLIQMKLNSFRPKDETHLEMLDECGLITAEMVDDLPDILRERLAQARARYSGDDYIGDVE